MSSKTQALTLLTVVILLSYLSGLIYISITEEDEPTRREDLRWVTILTPWEHTTVSCYGPYSYPGDGGPAEVDVTKAAVCFPMTRLPGAPYGQEFDPSGMWED